MNNAAAVVSFVICFAWQARASIVLNIEWVHFVLKIILWKTAVL